MCCIGEIEIALEFRSELNVFAFSWYHCAKRKLSVKMQDSIEILLE